MNCKRVGIRREQFILRQSVVVFNKTAQVHVIANSSGTQLGIEPRAFWIY